MPAGIYPQPVLIEVFGAAKCRTVTLNRVRRLRVLRRYQRAPLLSHFVLLLVSEGYAKPQLLLAGG
jgi:hypothetical protein